RKRELIEPCIAARLTDPYETERARWSDRKGHRRAPPLSCIRLVACELRPDLGAVASCVRLLRLDLLKRVRFVGRSKRHRFPARVDLRALFLALVRFRWQFRRWLFLGRNCRVPPLGLTLRQRERRLVGCSRAHWFPARPHLGGLLLLVSFRREFRRRLWVGREFRLCLVRRGLGRAFPQGRL